MNEKELSFYGATKAQNSLLKKHNKELMKENLELNNKLQYYEKKIKELCQQVSENDLKKSQETKQENLTKEIYTKEQLIEIKKDAYVQNILRTLKGINKLKIKYEKNLREITNKYIELKVKYDNLLK